MVSSNSKDQLSGAACQQVVMEESGQMARMCCWPNPACEARGMTQPGAGGSGAADVVFVHLVSCDAHIEARRRGLRMPKLEVCKTMCTKAEAKA